MVDDLQAAAERVLTLLVVEGDLYGEQVQLYAQGLEVTPVALRRPGVQGLQGFVDLSRRKATVRKVQIPGFPDDLEGRLLLVKAVGRIPDEFGQLDGVTDECDGLGVSQFFDPARVVIHPELSLAAGAVRGWDRHNPHYLQVIGTLATHYGFDIEEPWQELPEKERDRKSVV